jgi:glucuronokinase
MRTLQYVLRARVAAYAADVVAPMVARALDGGVVRQVPARVGLVGNPSDGYGGAVLATIVPEMCATVSAAPSSGLAFGGGGAHDRWPTLGAWLAHIDRVGRAGHGDEQRIISAALWVVTDHLRRTDRLDPNVSGVELAWDTRIPRSVGLAGSSALAIAVIDAATAVWRVELDRRVVAALALRAERDVLGIAAGWQDRIVQAFGCTVLVDAGQMDEVDGLEVPTVQTVGSMTPGSPDTPGSAATQMAELVVAWSEAVASSSDDYHEPLRRSAASLAGPMAELAALARHATSALVDGRLAEVSSAMGAGWAIRQACAPLRPEHAAIVDAMLDSGVSATTPGSGGAVVAMCLDGEGGDRAVDTARRLGCGFQRFRFV